LARQAGTRRQIGCMVLISYCHICAGSEARSSPGPIPEPLSRPPPIQFLMGVKPTSGSFTKY
jgi:hypothetical protein